MAKTDAFAETRYGTLQGVCIDGIYRFLGVRYAQSTEGKNRFMPPQPIAPWEGVKPALEFAGKCWQTDTPGMEDEKVRVSKYPENYEKMCAGSSEMGTGFQSEDCLAVNIWTQGLSDGKKRPVMVWFHGGGNIAGGAEADWHDGYSLAKKQDVVLVTVGHRLGIFGYLYLGGFGDDRFKYANVGNLDMAAALKWVNENIEAFGGDPDNVTIFGQSGGGGKVGYLMAMPAAKGLFKKAIIQSGNFLTKPLSVGIKNAKDLLDFLNIKEDNLDELQNLTAEELIRASRELNKERAFGNYFECPVLFDGEVLKYDPFDGAEGSEYCKDITLINGFTRDDRRIFALFNAAAFSYTYEELPERIAKTENCTIEKANELIRMLKGMADESCTPCDLYYDFVNDRSHFTWNIKRGNARAGIPDAAPMYSYVFCHEGNDPDMKAIHGVDVPFFFDNAIYAPGMWNTENRVEAMKLSEICGASWANFARTGNPSVPGLPQWLPYEPEKRYTMRIGFESELVSDYRRASREYIFGEDK